MRVKTPSTTLTLVWLFALAMLVGCTSTPDNIKPVTNFDLNRYLGKWYEIARLDHSFERGLSQITATYSLREGGGINVVNRGYNDSEGEWETAEGKAFFVDSADVGHLKVSFFGPFYASYVVMALDKQDYQYAMVTGPNRDYLWILSRTPTMQERTLNALLAQAKSAGYPVDDLIYVTH
ncbi:lipocalin family protein [Alteromonas halophila]|uniref:Outer membrane lipoprotein Blc n=1 Tax=Alteromonas halophila TaxID=516698 RepID=A0A918JIW9_9ALTE|nr:lipocalin family protein [Alteromonas halophila]GGW83358.1 outer membrane lipoprotein Blc [Alteromonas halophila]